MSIFPQFYFLKEPVLLTCVKNLLVRMRYTYYDTSFKVVKSTIGSTMTCRILSFALKNLELLPRY